MLQESDPQQALGATIKAVSQAVKAGLMNQGMMLSSSLTNHFSTVGEWSVLGFQGVTMVTSAYSERSQIMLLTYPSSCVDLGSMAQIAITKVAPPGVLTWVQIIPGPAPWSGIWDVMKVQLNEPYCNWLDWASTGSSSVMLQFLVCLTSSFCTC